MWRRLRSVNPRLRARTLEFADNWYALATTQTHGSLKDGNEARRFIRERERTLKGMRARLTYPDALNNGRGYPTSARLEFRWAQVQRIVADTGTAVVTLMLEPGHRRLFLDALRPPEGYSFDLAVGTTYTHWRFWRVPGDMLESARDMPGASFFFVTAGRRRCRGRVNLLWLFWSSPS